MKIHLHIAIIILTLIALVSCTTTQQAIQPRKSSVSQATNTYEKYILTYFPIAVEQMHRHPGLLQMHGLYLDSATGDVSFDFVVDFHCDGPALRDEAVAALQAQFPAYRFHVSLDTQFSD